MLFKLLCVVILNVVFFVVGLWQLEMVWIWHDVSWGYDFGGFGDFGLLPYQWRDIWYADLLFSYLLVVFALIAVVIYYEVVSVRKKN